MAALTVTTTSAAGVVLPASAAADVLGDTFVNTGREQVEITNGSGSSITVTITTTNTYNVGAVTYPIADLTVTIAAGVTKACGPFDVGLFSAVVAVAYSAVTTVTVRAISLGTA